MDCNTSSERMEVLKDWLHPKPPSTLLKSMNSSMKFPKALA